MAAPAGVVLYDGPSRLGGKRILAIATGIHRISRNAKTGPMAQIWIVCADVSPVAASQTGADASICGACPLRHHLAAGTGNPLCYVTLVHSPRAVWEAWTRGAYPRQSPHTVQVGDRPIRLGAYGDPSAVPTRVWRTLCKDRRHTAYTHTWARRPSLKGIAMAWVDTGSAGATARRLGWRTFRRRSSPADPLHPQEMVCPASAEGGKRTTCARCGLCDGSRGAHDTRRSIAILSH